MGDFSRDVYMAGEAVWGTPREYDLASRWWDWAARVPIIAAVRDKRKLTCAAAAAGCLGAAAASRQIATALSRAPRLTSGSRPRHRAAGGATAPVAAALQRLTWFHARWGPTPRAACTKDVAGTVCVSSSFFLRPVATAAHRRSSRGTRAMTTSALSPRDVHGAVPPPRLGDDLCAPSSTYEDSLARCIPHIPLRHRLLPLLSRPLPPPPHDSASVTPFRPPRLPASPTWDLDLLLALRAAAADAGTTSVAAVAGFSVDGAVYPVGLLNPAPSTVGAGSNSLSCFPGAGGGGSGCHSAATAPLAVGAGAGAGSRAPAATAAAPSLVSLVGTTVRSGLFHASAVAAGVATSIASSGFDESCPDCG